VGLSSYKVRRWEGMMCDPYQVYKDTFKDVMTKDMALALREEAKQEIENNTVTMDYYRARFEDLPKRYWPENLRDED
jgi:hypothetical protein